MATSLDLSRTYTSYSGVDIRVVINGKPAGSMQALSYAIQREKAPIYVMGSVDPISYSRGKRGIAGTMISLMMDRHFLHSDSFKGEKYLGDKDEMFASVQGDNVNAALQNAEGGDGSVSLNYNDGVDGVAGSTPITSADGIPQRLAYDIEQLSNNYRVSSVYYVDQILPFDIAIVAANEYGQSAQMRLYGCEILNEGSGFSIDDIVIENQMTYVCRTILPWRSFSIAGAETLYSGNAAARGYTSDK